MSCKCSKGSTVHPGALAPVTPDKTNKSDIKGETSKSEMIRKDEGDSAITAREGGPSGEASHPELSERGQSQSSVNKIKSSEKSTTDSQKMKQDRQSEGPVSRTKTDRPGSSDETELTHEPESAKLSRSSRVKKRSSKKTRRSLSAGDGVNFLEGSERSMESIVWGDHDNESDRGRIPAAKYSALSQSLRQSFPHTATCSLFCGGKKCKYCWPKGLAAAEDSVVKGLWSHWVTDNILACARPVESTVKEYGITDQFKELGIRSIINLQLPGEHASCGDGLLNDEFSYDPKTMMDNDVFFYNFGWQDFGVKESMNSLLDMVKVMQFAVSQGKIAVHCHAGLGRTGMLIACFLIFNNRMTSTESVNFIRSRRPGAIQTGPQIKTTSTFEQFLKPYRIIFSTAGISPLSLSQFLSRQKSMLHGYEGRRLKQIPKVVFVICKRLNFLCQASSGGPSSSQKDMLTALLHVSYTQSDVRKKIDNHKRTLNESSLWDDLEEESDPAVLAGLLWDWLDHLKAPVLRRQDISILFQHQHEPSVGLGRLEHGVYGTLIHLLTTISTLNFSNEQKELVTERLVYSLTHHPYESGSTLSLYRTLSSSSQMDNGSTSGIRSTGEGEELRTGPTNGITSVREEEELSLNRTMIDTVDGLASSTKIHPMTLSFQDKSELVKFFNGLLKDLKEKP